MTDTIVVDPDTVHLTAENLPAVPEDARFCNSPLRGKPGRYCKKWAGNGTDHVGVGRCSLHGGKNQSPDSKNFKHGLRAQIQYPMIVEKANQLRKDRDVFDLRDHIFLMEAIAQTILEQASQPHELFPLVKVLEACTKAIERLHNIEVGRRYVISVETMGGIIGKVVEVIERHIPDPYTRALIAEEITRLNRTRIPVLEARPIGDEEGD